MYKYDIEITEIAERELNAIALYIADDSPQRAITFTDEIIDKFTNVISLFPLSGVKHKEYFCFTYKRYLVFYKVNEIEGKIYIMHIINSAQYTEYQNFVE